MMNPPVRHLLFDCDGVLVDSEILATRVALREMAPYGYHTDPASFSRDFAGMTNEAILNYLADEKGIRWPKNFYGYLKEKIHEAMEAELMPVRGMPELVRQLPFPKSVVSNSAVPHVQLSLEKAGLTPDFEGRIFSANMVARPKPDPSLYRMALHRIGMPPSAGMVVEDSAFGVRAAKAAGLRVIGFLAAGHITPGHSEMLRKEGADFVAQSVEDLGNLLL